ncbi:MAG: UDP-N-acetylmuramoyl-tripeptide--D-alanyl-D-alanine ligase [Myxococcales bacterium]|nr:MAG: UDP-N-acetylmuramoyl-tripeptide--D-alanyl-D-alanine ligase [Myxococcales bacterium]
MATPIPVNEVRFSLAEICSICKGTLLSGNADDEIVGVSTDTRSVKANNLFVAIAGERMDGHDYIKTAVKAGAKAVIVSQAEKAPKDIAVIEVPDGIAALGDLAAAHRRRWGGYVVAVSGSAGKTMTKDFAAAVLKTLYKKVHKTEGNLNNLIGLPMTLLALSEKHQLAVVELGINQPGEMERLASIAQPDAAVITNVSAVHTEGLSDEQSIAKEKGALLRALSPKGLAVVHGDSEYFDTLIEGLATERLVRFGSQDSGDVQLRAQHINPSLRNECTIALSKINHEIPLQMRQLGEGAAMNAAAVVALVTEMVTATDPKAVPKAIKIIAKVLNDIPGAPHRFNLRRGPKRSLLIDDTYNASPAAMSLALDTASEIAQTIKGRLFVVLGDMKELGERSKAEHRKVGRHVVAVSAMMFVGFGPEMKVAVESSSETTGLAAPTQAISINNALDAVAPVVEKLQERDVILIKGSRAMQMERIVKAMIEADNA